MKSPTAISAVLWDLGGVIFRTEDTSHREKWEERFGLDPWGLANLVFGNEVSRRAFTGEATVDDVWDHVQVELDLVDEELHDLKEDFFAGDEIDLELVAFIREIKQVVKSGMITNAWPGTRHFIEDERKIGDAFDKIIVSAEVSVAKPEPRIYQIALDQLGVAAEEALFIDDFKVNIKGAEEVGMIGIHFQSADEVMHQVRKLLKFED